MGGTVSSRQQKVRPDSIPSFAFVGPMASGKNTYADELKRQIEERFGVTVYRPSFSAKIAEIATDLFGMKEKDRKLLQDIGAKMKEIDAGVWAKYLVRDALANGKLPLIVDGMRSLAEAEPFRESIPKFVIVRIETDESQRMEAYKGMYGRYPTKEEMNNITERTIADIPADMTVHNTYNVKDLKSHVKDLVKKIEVMMDVKVIRR